jgi:hypothetical protein
MPEPLFDPITISEEGSLKLRSVGHWQYWLASIAIVLLLLAAISFMPRYFGHAQTDGAGGDLPQLHETLLAEPASVGGSWLRTLNPTMQDVQGDLVWSTEKQQGVMRFLNLPQPASGKFYQLWLYDTRSADGKPISGAVFHQGSGAGEWFAPIQTQAHVSEPYKFELKLETENNTDAAQILLMVQP